MQVLPFNLPHIVSFIIFTASNALLLSSKYNVTGFIGVRTDFPVMGPLSIFLNNFFMAATDFSYLGEHDVCFQLNKGVCVNF